MGYLRRQPRTSVAILPVVLTVIAADDFHGTANLYGAFNVALAIGLIGGALVAAAWRDNRLRGILVLGAAFGAAQAVTALAAGRLAFLGLLTTVGFSNLAFQTVANSAIQLWTAPEMRGQVLGVYGQVFLGGTPIGAPIVGAFTEHVGAEPGWRRAGSFPSPSPSSWRSPCGQGRGAGPLPGTFTALTWRRPDRAVRPGPGGARCGSRRSGYTTRHGLAPAKIPALRPAVRPSV
jgi:MFS family permease